MHSKALFLSMRAAGLLLSSGNRLLLILCRYIVCPSPAQPRFSSPCRFESLAWHFGII